MAEMAGYDSRRKWDGTYSRSRPVADEPDAQTRAIVSTLRDLAGEGPVLELAVGDGRVAIPLAATGVEVDGIDISADAVELVRAHPGGGAVRASVADISDFALDRRYRLIYCVANSLFNVGQDAQVRCFELVAEHLTPGGLFLVDSGYTPRWFETLRTSQYVEARHLEIDWVWLQALRVDPVGQLVHQQDIRLTKSGTTFSPCVHRYSTLGELDLMARIAGLGRRDVWGSWGREPYGADSSRMIATYGRA